MNTNKREEKILELTDGLCIGEIDALISANPSVTHIKLYGYKIPIKRKVPSLPQNGDREKEWKCPCSCHDGSGVHFREECPCNQPDSPSEGKEKEPKYIHEPFLTKWYQGKQYCPSCPSILTITNNADTPSALAEKETAPTTDWEERFDERWNRPMFPLHTASADCETDDTNEAPDIKAFIQTLLKEKEAEVRAEEYRNGSRRIEALLKAKNEEFVKDLKSMPRYYSATKASGLNYININDILAKYSTEGNKENTKE